MNPYFNTTKLKCPKCNNKSIYILPTIELLCSDNYVDVNDHCRPCWDENTPCYCRDTRCYHKGTVLEFYEKY